MKKFYKIIILFTILIFLTTYNPNQLNSYPEKNNSFFKIKNINIIDNQLIDSDQIEKRLKKIYNRNIILIQRKDIEEPLISINFLEKIEVKKKYPDTIVIKVYETKPIAILLKKNKKYLIDSLSNLILLEEKGAFGELPSIFGENAEKNFVNFFEKLEKKNFLTKQVKNYYFFQVGRWDVQLLNNKIIKFPSTNITKAIEQSNELLSRDDFEKYNIIDLRIDGKVIVE